MRLQRSANWWTICFRLLIVVSFLLCRSLAVAWPGDPAPPPEMNFEDMTASSANTLYDETETDSDTAANASAAAAIQELAEATKRQKLQEAIAAVHDHLKRAALEDVHLSPDGRTLIWKIRSTANASVLSTTAKEVLGDKISAVKGFEAFNSLLIEMTEPSIPSLESILEFIGQVDKPQKQVFIKVVIAEIQIFDSLGWGGQLEILKDAIANSDLSGSMAVNHTLSSSPAEAAARAGFKLFLISGQIFKKFLYAQQTNSNFRVLSNPHIVATHGKQAKVMVGQEVNVRKSTSYRDGVVNIEYGKVPVGMSLSVTPYLQSDGMVSMDIVQMLSSLDSYDETLNLANTTNRLIQTSATAKIGQTVVLAGIIQKRKQRSRAGVPGLSRIPGIGKLFDRSDYGEQKIELLVFLTPDTVCASENIPVPSAEKGSSVSRDIQNFQTFRDHLQVNRPSHLPATISVDDPAISPAISPALSQANSTTQDRKERIQRAFQFMRTDAAEPKENPSTAAP